MSEQISARLKRKLDELAAYGGIDAETRRNALKEELQYYVLNFIYHHPEYNSWIMYGGSALRIVHGLDRMSVDLDFETPHPTTDKFLEQFKEEIEEHFSTTYGAGAGFMTVKVTTGRGLLLKFHVDEELSSGHPSKQVHIKIDLNHFVAPKTVHERRPINRDQLSFVIVTYNMSALMASKLAAIFLRGTRGVGEAIYEEKGRDIYDLLWYMGKKVVPDFDYLQAKNLELKDPRILFDKLTIQINKVSDRNLDQDLSPLFLDKTYITNWLKNWRESYLRLLDDYKIHTVKDLDSIKIFQDLGADIFAFIYRYATEDNAQVTIIYYISDYWLSRPPGHLPTEANKALEEKIEFGSNGSTSHPTVPDKLKQYAAMFYQKTEKYFQKTNRIMLGDRIVTKLIRLTADNLNLKEQIVLTPSALISSELDDLLK